MREHILCATDFSEGAEWAFQRAALVASRRSLALCLHHVVEDDGPSTTSASADEALARRAAAAADRGLRIETKLTNGRPEDVIAVAGQSAGCALVVLGTSRGLRPRVPRSTAEQVIRRCPTPILVVRRDSTAPYERALACLDFERTSEDALRSALDLDLVPEDGLAVVHAFVAPARGTAFLTNVPSRTIEQHAQAVGNEVLSHALATLRELGLRGMSVPVFIEEGEPYRLITRAAAQHAADLIIMGSHGRGPVAEFFLGSTASQVLRGAPCDILVKRMS